MTATYFRHGEGRSIAARTAESEARMPLTRAKRVVAQQLGCAQTVAAAALELLHDGEWHHVGKFAASCNYFDTSDCRLPGTVDHILACGGVVKWTQRRATVRASRHQRAMVPDGSRWYQFQRVAYHAIGPRFQALQRRAELQRAIAAHHERNIRYLCFLLGGAEYESLARRLTGRAYLDFPEVTQ